MLPLADYQGDFANALKHPKVPAPKGIARPIPDGPQTKRFDVYRNNLVVGVVKTLRDTFPAVEALVGEEFFAALARAYLDVSPPTSPLLFEYGKDFGRFLDGFPPTESVPYLGDVARLEFARLQAYHAMDADPLEIGFLATFAHDEINQVHLIAHPAVHVIRSRFPVASLWAASIGFMASDDVDMGKSEDVLITRPNLDVETIILGPGGRMFVQALLDGASLGPAAETTADAIPEFDLSTQLAGLFQAGTFVRADRPLSSSAGSALS